MDDDLHNSRSVRVLVMGDSGVGKSEFVSELCGMKCSAKGGTGLQAWVKLDRGLSGSKDVAEFVEVCGDTSYHKSVRWPMFKNVDGIILVYDMTDDSSCFSLKQWQASYDEFTVEQSSVTVKSHDLLNPPPQSHGWDRTADSLRTRGNAPRNSVSSQQSVPILIVGTHKDMAHRPRNVSSIWRRISRSLLTFQRVMAAIMRQVLFLPMPSFLFAAGAQDHVLEEFRSTRNTSFMEWAAVEGEEDPSEKLMEANSFLASLFESVHPTV